MHESRDNLVSGFWAVGVPVFWALLRFVWPASGWPVILTGLACLLSALTAVRGPSGLSLRLWAAARLALFYLTWLVLFWVMDQPGLLFFLSSMPLLYLAHRLAGNYGETVASAHVGLVGAVMIFVLARMTVFTTISWWAAAGLILMIFIIAWVNLVAAPRPAGRRVLAAALVGAVTTLLFIVLKILHLSWDVVALASFLGFDMAWILFYSWLYGIFNMDRLKFYSFFALLALGFALVLRAWL